MDLLFVFGKPLAKGLIGFAVGGSWSRSDSASLAAELFGSVVSELSALRADLNQRLDRIEALTEHLVRAPARSAIDIGLRHLEDADTATSPTERDAALDRATDAFNEAAVSATNAITVMPGMAVVAGDAELLVATTLLAANRLDKVPQALNRAENAYLAGVNDAAKSIVAIDDSVARDHFMTHASTRDRFKAKLGSSSATWWPSLEQLQKPVADQLLECLDRLNRYRADVKVQWAKPWDCPLIVPVTNNLLDAHLDDRRQLPVGVRLQSLRLALRPRTPDDEVAVGDYIARVVGHHVDNELELIKRVEVSVEIRTRWPSPHRHFTRLYSKPGPSEAWVPLVDGQQRVDNTFPIHPGWLLLAAAPIAWHPPAYSPLVAIDPPRDAEIALLPY